MMQGPRRDSCNCVSKAQRTVHTQVSLGCKIFQYVDLIVPNTLIPTPSSKVLKPSKHWSLIIFCYFEGSSYDRVDLTMDRKDSHKDTRVFPV